MLRNRAKRKYGTVAQEIQFSEFYRTAIHGNKAVNRHYPKNGTYTKREEANADAS